LTGAAGVLMRAHVGSETNVVCGLSKANDRLAFSPYSGGEVLARRGEFDLEMQQLKALK
jgi:hypothetical protein